MLAYIATLPYFLCFPMVPWFVTSRYASAPSMARRQTMMNINHSFSLKMAQPIFFRTRRARARVWCVALTVDFADWSLRGGPRRRGRVLVGRSVERGCS